MPKKIAIGMDLGGSNLRAGLVSEEGEILKKIKVPTPEHLSEALAEAIEEVREEGVAGIGVGVAGVVDRLAGRVCVSPNLHAVEGVAIREELNSRFGLPVFVENDANAAALGERAFGAGRDFRNFVLLTLGTGIGGGIIHEGKIMEVSAEIGHMSINTEGEKCPCGNTGCLENYASARAMIAKAITMIEKGTESLLKDCCRGSFYKLTPEDLYQTALEGDTLSREILKEAGKYLGVGLANIINIMSPEAVILAGGLVGTWNIYVQEAIREASRRAFKDLFDSVKIMPASLGDMAGVVGAAGLVFSGLSGGSAGVLP
jgi:glucokinase